MDRWTAWDRFLELTPATGFMQASWWADFRATAGYDHFAVVLRDGGGPAAGILGGALVQRFRHRSGSVFYYVQDGPVLPRDASLAGDVLAATLQAIDERHEAETETVSHLRIEPRWERLEVPLPGFEPAARQDHHVEPRNTLRVDLRPTPGAILEAMEPLGRDNIAVAWRRGVAVVEDTSTRGLAHFQGIYRDTAEREGFAPNPPAYFESLLGLTWPKHRGAIYFAEHRGLRLAAAMVIRFGARATCFHGGSLAERQDVMAPYLLHFEIMCRARQQGIETYELRGARAGVSGGEEVTLVPTLDRVYDRAAYDRYTAMEASPR